MKKVICILLSLVMILPLFCGCGKTYEEKKALAFEKAIKKNDQEAMNEYVEKYFEWSDLLNAEKMDSSKVFICDSSIRISFEEYYESFKKRGGVIARVSALSEYSQVMNSYEEPIITQKFMVEEIYHDFDGGQSFSVGDRVMLHNSGIGIDKTGTYIIQENSIAIAAPGHQYLVALEYSKTVDGVDVYYHSPYILDYEKEYEFLKPYVDSQNLLGRLTDTIFAEGAIKWRQSLLEVCKISDQYPFPKKHPYAIKELLELPKSIDGLYSDRYVSMEKIEKLIEYMGNQDGTVVLYYAPYSSQKWYAVWYVWKLDFDRVVAVYPNQKRIREFVFPDEMIPLSESKNFVFFPTDEILKEGLLQLSPFSE